MILESTMIYSYQIHFRMVVSVLISAELFCGSASRPDSTFKICAVDAKTLKLSVLSLEGSS